MFELNQVVWCYYDDVIPIVKGKIMDGKPYTTKGHHNREMIMYKVKWDSSGSSYFEECNIYTDKATLQERLKEEAERERMEQLNDEYELFIKLKESYPKTLKDATFDSELSASLKYLQSQIDSGYIDISDSCGDELVFKIMTEALNLYKDKHGLN